ncbi:MAG: hypothetical protein QOF83_3108 [Solirubrobacteraceae bacterium]|jgi:hypothetical protein|nr:hypothetical protein [Solirubrobacteraceae bacterium]
MKPERPDVKPERPDDIPAEPDYVSDEGEVVDGLPVLSEVRALDPAGTVALPAVQAAAAAATGFVAGAATLALLRRHSARRLARTRLQRRGPIGMPVVASRSFLVDVHLLAKPGE